MANKNIYIDTFEELPIFTLNADPRTVTVLRGDTLTFIYTIIQGTSKTITVGYFNPAAFTSSTNITLNTNGQSAVRSIRTDATVGTYPLSVATGNQNVNLSIIVNASTDTTPDPFYFTTVTTQPSAEAFSNTITVTGINSPTPISITGGSGAYYTVNGGGAQTSGSITVGAKIRIRQIAPTGYNQTNTASLNIGGVVGTWGLKTPAAPDTSTVVPFPITSGSVGLSSVIAFFGGSDPSVPKNLQSYFKGGALVPNIDKNSAIASSGNLSLGSFRGSGSAIYYSRVPGAINLSGITLSGPVTLSAVWDHKNPTVSSNPIVGFGRMAYSAEYSYRVIVTGITTGRSVASSAAGSIGSWSAWSTQGSIVLTFTSPIYTESYADGYVEFRIRPTSAPTVIATAVANFSFLAFGP